MRANHIRQEALTQEQREPEFAKQIAERNRHSADGDIHAVERPRIASAKKQLKQAHDVKKPPRRRYGSVSSLPAIKPEPGYHYCYVRRDHRYRGDNANLRNHQRLGWEMVRASEVPEEFLPTTSLAGFGDVIGNEDSVLMKIDLETWSLRNAEIEDRRDHITRLVNSNKIHSDFYHDAVEMEVLKNQSNSGIERGGRNRARDEVDEG